MGIRIAIIVGIKTLIVMIINKSNGNIKYWLKDNSTKL